MFHALVLAMTALCFHYLAVAAWADWREGVENMNDFETCYAERSQLAALNVSQRTQVIDSVEALLPSMVTTEQLSRAIEIQQIIYLTTPLTQSAQISGATTKLLEAIIQRKREIDLENSIAQGPDGGGGRSASSLEHALAWLYATTVVEGDAVVRSALTGIDLAWSGQPVASPPPSDPVAMPSAEPFPSGDPVAAAPTMEPMPSGDPVAAPTMEPMPSGDPIAAVPTMEPMPAADPVALAPMPVMSDGAPATEGDPIVLEAYGFNGQPVESVPFGGPITFRWTALGSDCRANVVGDSGEGSGPSGTLVVPDPTADVELVVECSNPADGSYMADYLPVGIRQWDVDDLEQSLSPLTLATELECVEAPNRSDAPAPNTECELLSPSAENDGLQYVSVALPRDIEQTEAGTKEAITGLHKIFNRIYTDADNYLTENLRSLQVELSDTIFAKGKAREQEVIASYLEARNRDRDATLVAALKKLTGSSQSDGGQLMRTYSTSLAADLKGALEQFRGLKELRVKTEISSPTLSADEYNASIPVIVRGTFKYENIVYEYGVVLTFSVQMKPASRSDPYTAEEQIPTYRTIAEVVIRRAGVQQIDTSFLAEADFKALGYVGELRKGDQWEKRVKYPLEVRRPMLKLSRGLLGAGKTEPSKILLEITEASPFTSAYFKVVSEDVSEYLDLLQTKDVLRPEPGNGLTVGTVHAQKTASVAEDRERKGGIFPVLERPSYLTDANSRMSETSSTGTRYVYPKVQNHVTQIEIVRDGNQSTVRFRKPDEADYRKRFSSGANDIFLEFRFPTSRSERTPK